MGMNVKEKARMYRELGKLLGASFPMDKSITMLLNQNPQGPKHDFLNGIQQGFAEGMSLAEALRTHNQGGASSMELSLIEAGERSGRLAESCEHLAHYFETWQKGVREARGAMIYPVLLLHLGVVLPEVSRDFMLGAMGRETHPVWAILSRLIVIWLALLIVWIAWRILTVAAIRSDGMDRVLGRLPVIGAVRRHWALARFTQVFHSGLLAAMGISECLRLAGDASQSGVLLQGAQKAALTVEGGGSLSQGLADSSCFPQDFTNGVITAEAAGGMDKEMARWAEAEISLAVEAQKSAAEWYPKMLYFGVLGYIAFRIVGLFQDYYGTLLDMTK